MKYFIKGSSAAVILGSGCSGDDNLIAMSLFPLVTILSSLLLLLFLPLLSLLSSLLLSFPLEARLGAQFQFSCSSGARPSFTRALNL